MRGPARPAGQSVTREPRRDDTLLSLAVNGFSAFTRLSSASRLQTLAPSIATAKCYFVFLFTYCFHNDVPINSDCMPITGLTMVVNKLKWSSQKVRSPHFLGDIKENHERHQSGYFVPLTKFEQSICPE
jgi:hypothetical protein